MTDQSTDLASSQQPHPPVPLDIFTLFSALPPEFRLIIWREVIPVDFDHSPLYVKPYSYTFHHHRQPPKTSRINHESRIETLKHFQRIQIECPDLPGRKLNSSEEEKTRYQWKHLKQNPRVVWWDKEVDVLVLDFWAFTADVEDPISYLALGPFMDQKNRTICIKTL
jgi:hypothetical protein